jgi:hypothetical protein
LLTNLIACQEAQKMLILLLPQCLAVPASLAANNHKKEAMDRVSSHFAVDFKACKQLFGCPIYPQRWPEDTVSSRQFSFSLAYFSLADLRLFKKLLQTSAKSIVEKIICPAFQIP